MNLSAGVKYMLMATFMFTVMNVFVKLVPHIPAIEIILFRSLVSLIISLYYLQKQRVSVWGNNKPVLMLRGLAGAAGLIIYFHLLQRIPLATASTLNYLAPIFTTVIGIFLVKEQMKLWQWLFFAVSFGGVVMVEGFDARISEFHLLLGVAASLFMGLAYNFIRMLKTSEHPLVVIFYFPLVMVPISGVWSAMVWTMPKGWDWLVLIAVGVFTQIAQYFMTKAYQLESLSKVSIINYAGIVFAIGFGWVIFDENFNAMTYLGMLMVIGGVVANVWVGKRTS